MTGEIQTRCRVPHLKRESRKKFTSTGSRFFLESALPIGSACGSRDVSCVPARVFFSGNLFLRRPTGETERVCAARPQGEPELGEVHLVDERAGPLACSARKRKAGEARARGSSSRSECEDRLIIARRLRQARPDEPHRATAANKGSTRAPTTRSPCCSTARRRHALRCHGVRQRKPQGPPRVQPRRGRCDCRVSGLRTRISSVLSSQPAYCQSIGIVAQVGDRSAADTRPLQRRSSTDQAGLPLDCGARRRRRCNTPSPSERDYELLPSYGAINP